MKNKIFFQTSIFFFLVTLFTEGKDDLFAQPVVNDSSKKSFRLFKDEKLLDITLRFDLATYFRSKPQKDYLKANLTIHLSESDSINKDIRLKTRGVFRNQYCVFPPIELNVKKADFGYSDLDKISKLKLVPQCSTGKDKEDYVLREYIAYRLFNVLTDTSFRVRLLTINYIDTKRKRKPLRQYGFFIEPVDRLTSRLNSVQIKSQNLTQKSIVPAIMDRLALFNYMIGNYDWSVPGQHNILVIKTLKLDPYGLGIAIPHDFDWTGLVNASYAIPAEFVGTENVRERLFLGVCRNRETYQRDLDLFLAKKAEFYKVINDFPYLNLRAKKDMIGYLDSFFDHLAGKKEFIINNLMKNCKDF